MALNEALGKLCIADAYLFTKIATQKSGGNSGDGGANNGGTTTVTMTSTGDVEE